MENPIKIDDLGVPLFLETPMSWQTLQLCKSMVKLGSSTGHWSNTCESAEAVAWSTLVGRKSFRKAGQNLTSKF